MGETNKQQEFSVDLLRVYYGRLFPYDHMYNWLSYWNGQECGLASNDQVIDRDFFPKREWSFTIEDDIYIRYQSFRDKSEFMAAIQKRQPHKIDIGAVFSSSPKEHTSVKPESFKPVERELVFDIDMTDYDNIRKCCSGANICRKCWPYMTMAIKVIDESLRSDFDFRNILWIYSGRRGVHCWVCDVPARQLTNEQRTAIVDYLSVETGSTDNTDKKIKSSFSGTIHPMIRRAYATLEPMFEKYIIHEDGQSLLTSKESYMKILQTLPIESVRHDLFEEWEKEKDVKCATSLQRWKSLKNATTAPIAAAAGSSFNNSNNKKKTKQLINYVELEAWRMELVFTHCYPRLDANVSKAQNHLLKSPFCIHPKTGRVCVPIDPKRAEEFDPFSVPTLRVLCEEVDRYDAANPIATVQVKDENDNKNDINTSTIKVENTQSSSTKSSSLLGQQQGSNGGGGLADYKKTSLKHALQTFEKTFLNELRSNTRSAFKEKESAVAAMNVDF